MAWLVKAEALIQRIESEQASITGRVSVRMEQMIAAVERYLD
jgi:hypothetical protein